MTIPEQQIQAILTRLQAVPGLGSAAVQRTDVYAVERQQRPAIDLMDSGFKVEASRCGCWWDLPMQPTIRILANDAAQLDTLVQAVVARLDKPWPVASAKVAIDIVSFVVSRADTGVWSYLLKLNITGLRCKPYDLSAAHA